jgi:PAS domain S-box-containing protein
MLDDAGNPCGMWAVVRDIIERKWAEEALREYEKVVEGSQDMIAVVDRKYRFLIINNAFLKYHDRERDEVLGCSVAEILGKEVFEGVRKNLEECFRGKVVQYEMKRTYPKLGKRDLLISYFPIEGPNGIDSAASVISDITDRKRAEEELRLTQFSLEEASDSVFWMDPEGHIVYVNKAACRSLNRSREEMLSLSIPDIDPNLSPAGWRATWEKVKARGPAEALTLVEHDAGPIHLLLTDVVMPGMSGKDLATRTSALRPEAKMLYMSGYTEDAVGSWSPLRSFSRSRSCPIPWCRKSAMC